MVKNPMDLKEIAENYSKQKRKMMTEAVIRNQKYTRDFPTYHAESLNIMFVEWHLLFPSQKQDIKCTSCRAAICKFWETMVDEWIITEQTSIKKPNASKKRKTKAK
jgi:hypothetical protein